VVVGAWGDDSSTTGINSTPNEGALDAGAAYVFVRSGSTWSQQAYLKASQVTAYDQFGYSVAVSGDTVVVGATDENSSSTGVNSTPNELADAAGAAYIFTGLGPAPTVTNVSPASGSTAGGTNVTITGTNLTGATSVTIGGTAATSVVVVDGATITAVTPAGTAGTASVLVTTPLGTNAANTLFTYVVPAPDIAVQPLSQLVLLGGAAAFNPVVTGDEPMTLQWKKGTAVIKGATLSTYTIPLTKTADLGAYILTADNPVGPPVTSRPAYLGIVTPMVGTQVIKKGTTLNLKATVAAPVGTGVVLRYSWRRGPDVLGNGIQPNGAVVSGADKAALSITKMGMADAGTYSCLITLDTPGNDPQLANGETVVRVVDALR
jgi:hypothetical protein